MSTMRTSTGGATLNKQKQFEEDPTVQHNLSYCFRRLDEWVSKDRIMHSGYDGNDQDTTAQVS